MANQRGYTIIQLLSRERLQSCFIQNKRSIHSARLTSYRRSKHCVSNRTWHVVGLSSKLFTQQKQPKLQNTSVVSGNASRAASSSPSSQRSTNLARNSNIVITEACVSEFQGNKVLQVTWQNDTQSLFPFIFLRDNCLCPQCYEKSAKQRLFETLSVELNIEAQNVIFDAEQQSLEITWPNGHTSVFESTWLAERQFPKSKDEQIEKSKGYFPKKLLWDSSFDVPTADFQSILTDDFVRYSWLSDLATYGLTLIKNAPKEPNQLPKIAEKIGGYIRQTHYGDVYEVKSKPDPSNIAYSGHEIPLHVDLAYYMYQPGTQYLHCIEQTEDTEGGQNCFVDGFSIAEWFRQNAPETFDVLTSKKFTFRDIGTDEYGLFEKKLERPVIGLNDLGEYTSIAYNNFTRSSFLNATLPDVYLIYDAYLKWTKAINDPKNQIEGKIKPGDIWAFDNLRILHARKKFDVMKSTRYLQGLYIDWDEVYSTIRSLRRSLRIITDESNSFRA